MIEEKTIYDFTMLDINKKKVKLDIYKGKVLIIVNSACKCGFQKQNFENLADLLHLYFDKHLRVLLFPSADFLKQEFEDNKKTKEFIEAYSNKFDIFDKTTVTDSMFNSKKKKHELFEFLVKKSPSSLIGKSIKWNFTKFLIDRDGVLLKRYGSTDRIEKDDVFLEKALSGSESRTEEI